MERLRAVLRIAAAHPTLLAHEAAEALLACTEPAERVVACRRLLDHRPACGPLWWVASLAVTAADPHRALVDALEALDQDLTPHVVAQAVEACVRVIVLGSPEQCVLLPRDERVRWVSRGRARPGVDTRTVVLADGWALGPPGFLCDPETAAGVETARSSGATVWVLAGVGRALPSPVWDAALARSRHRRHPATVVDGGHVGAVLGPSGRVAWDDALGSGSWGPACPIAPELLR